MKSSNILHRVLSIAVVPVLLLFGAHVAQAEEASLFITPPTAIYPIGEQFTVEVRVNTGGGAVGSADATVAYEPDDLSLVSFSSEGSIFSRILVDDSRTPGRIDVSGFVEGSRPEYTGGDGLMVQLSFVPKRNVATQVRFTQAAATPRLVVGASLSELANMLTSLSAATYTLVPREYVPAQTAAVSASAQAGDIAVQFSPEIEGDWYATSSVKASWSLPKGATGMRTSVSSSSKDTPTKVYPVPVSSVVLHGLRDGKQYFHLQFEYGNKWSEAIHVPLNVDTTPPKVTRIREADTSALTDKRFALHIEAIDDASGVESYEVAIDGGEQVPWEDTGDGLYRPVDLSAGEHVATVYARDVAGNIGEEDYVFMIRTIESPVMTDVPERVLTGDAITIGGTTYPNSKVTVFISYNDGDAAQMTVQSDATGRFTATVTEGAREGKYTIWFSVTDTAGATSPPSIKRSIDVSQPFIMLFGSIAVTYLSVIVPLIALILVLGLVIWLGYSYVRSFRKHVRRETNEAYGVVRDEFEDLRDELTQQIGMLEKANQSRKLTREEMRIFNELSKRLDHVESHIEQEIDDITRIQDEAVETQGVAHDTLAKYQKPTGQSGARAQAAQPVTPSGHTLRIERV